METFEQFLEKYNKKLVELGKPELTDKALIRTLRDFYEKEMPSDFVGYIKAMEKVYKKD